MTAHSGRSDAPPCRALDRLRARRGMSCLGSRVRREFMHQARQVTEAPFQARWDRGADRRRRPDQRRTWPVCGGARPWYCWLGDRRRRRVRGPARRAGLRSGALGDAGDAWAHRPAWTHGDRAETAAWARENGVRWLFRRDRPGYHMPRAMTEVARDMPEVALYPVSISTPGPCGAGRPAGQRNAAADGRGVRRNGWWPARAPLGVRAPAFRVPLAPPASRAVAPAPPGLLDDRPAVQPVQPVLLRKHLRSADPGHPGPAERGRTLRVRAHLGAGPRTGSTAGSHFHQLRGQRAREHLPASGPL